MVDKVFDPVRPVPITMTATEREEIRLQIEAGNLPPNYLDRCDEARDLNVFGFDAKKDRQGNYIEQGRGSLANQTHQSVEAYRKWGKDEPDYERHLARMQKELAASEAHRKANPSPVARR